MLRPFAMSPDAMNQNDYAPSFPMPQEPFLQDSISCSFSFERDFSSYPGLRTTMRAGSNAHSRAHKGTDLFLDTFTGNDAVILESNSTSAYGSCIGDKADQTPRVHRERGRTDNKSVPFLWPHHEVCENQLADVHSSLGTDARNASECRSRRSTRDQRK